MLILILQSINTLQITPCPNGHQLRPNPAQNGIKSKNSSLQEYRGQLIVLRFQNHARNLARGPKHFKFNNTSNSTKQFKIRSYPLLPHTKIHQRIINLYKLLLCNNNPHYFTSTHRRHTTKENSRLNFSAMIRVCRILRILTKNHRD